MLETFAPLSVRRGLREPLPYSEGVPDHIHQQAFAWVAAQIDPRVFDKADLALMVARLGMPRDGQNLLTNRVLGYCRSDDDAFLDVLDYLLHLRVTQQTFVNGEWMSGRSDEDIPVQALSDLFDAGRSCWKVGWIEESSGDASYRVVRQQYRLERRVTEAAEQEYLYARGIGGKAGDKLTEAWHAAYGHHEDAGQCWKASISAVEAALQPIVAPKEESARLGKMRKQIRDAPQKWICALPVWDDEGLSSVEAFLTVLNRITYEDGRHGGDVRVPNLQQARAVLMATVTVVEWIRGGVFARAEGARG